ncbi:MAG: TrbC/VirB2 family protein [Bryobacterales bacterium]|nr:TrbC/VirB2 family protein [Bryobacterales bacterium]
MRFLTKHPRAVRLAALAVVIALQVAPLAAATAPTTPTTSQGPWVNAVQVLQGAFTTTIARGLALIAIVIAGIMFAFGEGGSKRALAGVVFGVGMAVGAANFLTWLFP